MLLNPNKWICRICVFPVLISFLFVLELSAYTKSQLETVSLQLRWFHKFQFAGYYAAVEKGFYAEEGLDVKLKNFDPEKGRHKPVFTGEVDYGISDATLLKFRKEGQPVVLLSQIFQYSPLVLLTSKESGIISPKMLEGKKVMYVDVQASAMFNHTLGNAEKVQQIPHSYNYNDIFTGKVDAMAAYISDQPFKLWQEGKKFNIINPRDYGINFYGDNLFTTENEIINHPRRAEKMIRATIKGWKYAHDHPDEIIDLIISKYDPNLSRPQLEYEAGMIYMMIQPDLVNLGKIDTAKYKSIAEEYLRLKMTNSGEVPDGFIYKGGSDKPE